MKDKNIKIEKEIMNYIFKIEKSFGDIEFTDTSDMVIAKIGKPTSTFKEEFDDGKVVMKTIDDDYENLGLSLQFTFSDNLYEGCTIFSEKIILDGQNLYDLRKKELLEFVSKYSKLKIEDAFYQADEKEKKLLGTYNDDMYIFNDIGLTLWIHKTKLDDACIYKPRNDGNTM